MKTLHQFLTLCRQNLNKTNRIVVGNEALDMDTAAMTLSHAFYLTETKNQIHLPVFNIPSNLYHLKTEVVYALDKCGIQKSDLVFLDDLQQNTTFETTLVDCNVYKGKLAECLDIVRIIDHHKPEVKCEDLKFPKESIIWLGIGSGSSLTLQSLKDSQITEEKCLRLLAAAVILDTTNFSKTIGKLHEKDLEMYEFAKANIAEKDLLSFEELSEAKFSVKGFSREEVLLKDAKYIMNDSIIIAALACSSADFENLENDDINSSLDKFMDKNGVKQVFAISKILKDENAENIRELVVYPKATEEFQSFFLADEIVKPKLISAGPDFTLFRWWNMKPTRKYILPKLTEFYAKFN